ncbi:protein twisted gastrulation-like [Panonychus citri]|uniref:protein twisted gastrulation-like n=1 Tax=Panonychus citri TaxID=50023 RepID=UPI0023082492|nr:protein twisted gastrulation-like [Panonychus citri]XP_053212225.1 protein twisted gastrulation-like [Panonychus citri]
MLIVFLALLSIYQVLQVSMNTDTCNEHVCASIVSKCMLTQSCKCDTLNNLTCSKDCSTCLDYLYSECCSCLEMCPPQNSTYSILSTKSHFEALDSQSAELFTALTRDEDPLERWVAFTFPTRKSFIVPSESQAKEIVSDPKVKVTMKTDGQDTEEDIQANCTVAYLSHCLSWNKCKSSCSSMGAISYRWFHDGCCECVGPYCIDFGLDESKCLHCPLIGNKNDEPSETAPNSVVSS